jgi:hypothetical protein
MYCMMRFAASVFPAPDSPLPLEDGEKQPDDDALIVFVALHIVEGRLGDGKHMRRHLSSG